MFYTNNSWGSSKHQKGLVRLTEYYISSSRPMHYTRSSPPTKKFTIFPAHPVNDFSPHRTIFSLVAQAKIVLVTNKHMHILGSNITNKKSNPEKQWFLRSFIRLFRWGFWWYQWTVLSAWLSIVWRVSRRFLLSLVVLFWSIVIRTSGTASSLL